MAAIVEFNGISKRFGGTTALEGVSFSVERGAIHALKVKTAPASPRS
jgi:ABC-type sugar transport system ATPase subunit